MRVMQKDGYGEPWGLTQGWLSPAPRPTHLQGRPSGWAWVQARASLCEGPGETGPSALRVPSLL